MITGVLPHLKTSLYYEIMSVLQYLIKNIKRILTELLHMKSANSDCKGCLSVLYFNHS